MKLNLLILSILFLLTTNVCIAEKLNHDSIKYKEDTLKNIYIPKDLEDCFVQIDKHLTDSVKENIKKQSEEEFANESHFGIGLWIRNNWKLWKGGRLSEYFTNKGIYHPDDMSDIILKSYYRYLKGKDILLEEQIRVSKSYWQAIKEPEEKDYPKSIKNIKLYKKIPYQIKKDSSYSCLHIQTNARTDKVWIYDYILGWKQVDKKEIDKLWQKEKNIEDRIIALFSH